MIGLSRRSVCLRSPAKSAGQVSVCSTRRAGACNSTVTKHLAHKLVAMHAHHGITNDAVKQRQKAGLAASSLREGASMCTAQAPDTPCWVTKSLHYLIFGSGLAILALLVPAAQHLPRVFPPLFAIGCMLGLAWEFPLSFPNWRQDPLAAVRAMLQPVRLLYIASICAWDALLLLVGWALVLACCPGPHFVAFSGLELLVMVLWGQLSSLAVEVIAAAANLWSYKPGPGNPLLFTIRPGRDITALPQYIWLAASCAFYAASLCLPP